MFVLYAIGQKPLEDFLSDPVLTVACVLLILVALMWIVTARVIAHRQRAAIKAQRRRQAGGLRAKKSPPTRTGGAPTQTMRRSRD